MKGSLERTKSMENMVSKGHRIYHPNVLLLQEVVVRKA
jgi:hypothetical protein